MKIVAIIMTTGAKCLRYVNLAKNAKNLAV